MSPRRTRPTKTRGRGQKNFALGPLKEVYEQWCRRQGYDERLTFLAAWSAFDELAPAERVRYFGELPLWTERMEQSIAGSDADASAAGGDAALVGGRGLHAVILPDGTIASASQSLLRLLGSTAAAVLGRPLWSITANRRGRASVVRTLERVGKDEPAELKLRMMRPDGRTVRINWTLTGFFDSDGDLSFCNANGEPDDG